MMKYEDHALNGEKFQKCYNFMMKFSRDIIVSYGDNDRAARLAKSISEDMMRLKSSLDDKVCSENPTKSDKDVIGCYYCNDRLNGEGI